MGIQFSDDKSVNAWCMPGGKIVFYTRILPIAKNETGLPLLWGMKSLMP